MTITRFHPIWKITATILVSSLWILPVSAQRTGGNIAPSRFLKKSFSACARILGKSVAVKNPNVDYGAFSRYHRSPNRNISCVVLSSDNDAAVECVTYQFPKGKQTAVTACRLLGVTAKTRKSRDRSLHVISNKFAAEWEQATPNGSHPKQDWLTFFAL